MRVLLPFQILNLMPFWRSDLTQNKTHKKWNLKYEIGKETTEDKILKMDVKWNELVQSIIKQWRSTVPFSCENCMKFVRETRATFMRHSCDTCNSYPTLVQHSCDAFVKLVILSYNIHATLVQLMCDTHMTLMQHSCDIHSTLVEHYCETRRTLIRHSCDTTMTLGRHFFANNMAFLHN